MNRRRFRFFVVLLAVGTFLVFYGALFNKIIVFDKGFAASDPVLVGQNFDTLTELDLTLESTRDGVHLLETGEIQSTRAAGEAPAAFCPT
ncbi:MAG: hypothetical protein GY869_12690 [Planctomycetes bacterium]|nr:hypothetical protein [Planctomycetota bacterium]